MGLFRQIDESQARNKPHPIPHPVPRGGAHAAAGDDPLDPGAGLIERSRRLDPATYRSTACCATRTGVITRPPCCLSWTGCWCFMRGTLRPKEIYKWSPSAFSVIGTELWTALTVGADMRHCHRSRPGLTPVATVASPSLSKGVAARTSRRRSNPPCRTSACSRRSLQPQIHPFGAAAARASPVFGAVVRQCRW